MAPLNMAFDVLSDWPGNEPEKADIRVKGDMSVADYEHAS
jgi:hypothetical protein